MEGLWQRGPTTPKAAIYFLSCARCSEPQMSSASFPIHPCPCRQRLCSGPHSATSSQLPWRRQRGKRETEARSRWHTWESPKLLIPASSGTPCHSLGNLLGPTSCHRLGPCSCSFPLFLESSTQTVHIGDPTVPTQKS